MICLDTNYLIMGLVAGSDEATRLLAWAESGETFSVSSIVWYEFLCGPITNEQEAAMQLLVPDIVVFDGAVAREAARLFNAVGRSRRLRVDAMIAATAIIGDTPLATRNLADFSRFTDLGLRLFGTAPPRFDGSGRDRQNRHP